MLCQFEVIMVGKEEWESQAFSNLKIVLCGALEETSRCRGT
jgi:hypothetical protein